MHKILRLRQCRKLRSKFYRQIIEVRVPVRFYWNDDGFDGVEFGPLQGLNKYQHKLINNILDELMNLMEQSHTIQKHNYKAITKIPDIFRKAFGE